MARKQRSARLAIMALVELTLPDGRNIFAYVANMSRGGMGIYLQEPLEAGTEVSIKLTYQDKAGKKKSKIVSGQLKWTYPGFYTAGIALRELNKKEHGDLLKYFESLEQFNRL